MATPQINWKRKENLFFWWKVLKQFFLIQTGFQSQFYPLSKEEKYAILIRDPFKSGETQILKVSKRCGGGEPEKKSWGGGKQKGEEDFLNQIGGNPSWIQIEFSNKRGKSGDFQRQISINFLKNLPAAAKEPSSLEIYCVYNTKMVVKNVFTVISTYSPLSNCRGGGGGVNYSLVANRRGDVY